MEDRNMSEEKSFFEKNMQMWERWTSSYMDTMAAAMEKTMEQSTALRKQVDKVVATAVGTQMDATLAAIRALEKQVETLAGKIDEMLQKED
jgi:ABC-type phosphate transport system auxiliary subunit